MTVEMPPAYSTLNESTAKHKVPDNLVLPGNSREELTIAPSFVDKDTRIAFIQKVLSITLLQLLLITKIMFFFKRSPLLRSLVGYNFAHYSICSSLAYLLVLGWLIHSSGRWKTPNDCIFLVLYSVTFGCFISILSHGFFVFEIISIAMSYFCNVLLALLIYSVFALHHKVEFEVKTGIYITLGLLTVLFSTSVPYLYLDYPLAVLYPTTIVYLLTAYILYDLEAMVSKPYRFEITPADFVMGALILHIDHRYIFMKFWKSMRATFCK